MPFRRPWSPWGPPRLPWAPNPDERDQELRRRARAGDAGAARALAQSLLRKGRLTVQELALIGEPGADALPEELRVQLVRILAPKVWSVVHSWDDPGRGPGSAAAAFLSEEAALREAATRALNIVAAASDWIQPGQYDDGDDVLEGHAEGTRLLDSDPRGSWAFAESALAALQRLDADEENNRVEIVQQQGLAL